MMEPSTSVQAPLRARGLTIAHFASLEESDQPAFAHAVALGLSSESTLTSIHAGDDAGALARMPRAAALLARWGAAQRDPARAAEAAPSLSHTCLVDSCCEDVVDTLLHAVGRVKPDLLVATTGARAAVRRTLAGSVAEAVAVQLSAPTLLLPVGCRPFVDPESGALGLTRVLVAAGDEQATRVGTERALWLANMAGASELELELLHAGASTPAPSVPTVTQANVRVHVHQVAGSPAAQVAARARAWPADVIVMATRGRDSLRDVLLGSHTERTLHLAPCPVLSIPLP